MATTLAAAIELAEFYAEGALGFLDPESLAWELARLAGAA